MDPSYYDELVALQKQYVMSTNPPNLLLVKGQGSYVWDRDDRRYLDFSMGISVSNLGHCHPAVAAAIKQQVDKLMHVSNLYMNENQPRLAAALCRHGMDGKVFFGNSGAEANEGLIKFARRWGFEQGKYEIIAMEDSFHGRTLATLAATGRAKYRHGFSPDMPGFTFVPYNNLDAIKKAITPQTAAVMMEPVQGEGGIIPADPDYLRQVRELCTEKNILLLFDEVQCGMGRTGNFYAWQGYGIQPDALSMAKALGNGFPIGAFIVGRKYAEVLQPGMHASTFGGSPLACAAALAVIEYIDSHKVLQNCSEQGAYLMEKLTAMIGKYPVVKGVRGRGLMLGVVLDRPAAQVLPLLREKGLLALSAGETVLRLMPALTLTRQEADEAVAIIDQVFKSPALTK